MAVMNSQATPTNHFNARNVSLPSSPSLSKWMQRFGKQSALIVHVAVLVLWATGTASAASKAVLSFKNTVEPFLVKHCVDCHDGTSKKTQLNLESVKHDFSVAKTADLWVGAMQMLQFDEMPPPKKKRPDAIAKANVISWILQELDKSGRSDLYHKKLLAPEYGNWVSHENLFSGEIKTPPFSPSRLWRFSPAIFKSKGFGRARSPFTYVTPETGIRDYATMSGVDRSTVQMILINADQFLEQREGKGDFKTFAENQPTPTEQVLADSVRAEFRRVIGREPSDAERAKYLAFLKKNIKDGGNLDGLKTTIKAMFLSPEAIYRTEIGLGQTDKHGRRHLSPEELAYAVAYALTDRGPDHAAAIKQAYAGNKLSNKEDVARVVKRLLDEQLGTGHWDRRDLPRIMRFFEEFFGFDRAGEVFKDNERIRREKIPQWNTGVLIHDARMLIEHVLKHDKDVIAELLTTNRYFIAHPGDNVYAREFYEQRVAEVNAPGYVESQVARRKQQLENKRQGGRITQEEWERQLNQTRKDAERTVLQYTRALEAGINPHPNFPFSNRSRGIADLIYIAPYNLPTNNRIEQQRWNWPVEQPVSMPEEQRAGLLTHPAWLAAWSLNEGNDPIHRGIWVREKLLAGVIQDVPPDVDAKVPNDPHKTLRERMEPLRAERCWSCHRKINPLGETFEIFDDWGRHRTQVYFDEENKIVTRRDATFEKMLEQKKLTVREIDATGAITGSGDPKVDGEVKDAIEMMHRLGNSDRTRQSFIRHLFRYFMGRNEMLSDSKTLIEAEQAYLKNGGSFKALVVSLLSSDSFLYRR